jgi:biopolymer transport protein ExbD
MKRRSRRRRSPQVNIVPLVDVLIVLVFFFLVAVPLQKTPHVEIDLPGLQSAGQDAAQQPSLVVVITRAGELLVDGQLMEATSLSERFELAAAQSPPPVIIIHGDRGSPLEALTTALDLARLAGLKKIAVASSSVDGHSEPVISARPADPQSE